jgi:hypothetical protein
LAAVTVFAMILALFLLASLFNAMINPIYLIAAGGLVNIVPARTGPRASDRAGGARTPVARPAGGRPVSPAPWPMSGRRGETIRSGAIVEVATRSSCPGKIWRLDISPGTPRRIAGNPPRRRPPGSTPLTS